MPPRNRRDATPVVTCHPIRSVDLRGRRRRGAEHEDLGFWHALSRTRARRVRVGRDLARLRCDPGRLYDYIVTLVDLRGHGDSPRADRYRVSDFVGDLVDTLPTGLDLLVGQSLGGRAGMLALPRLTPKRFIGLDPALFASTPARLALRYLSPVMPHLPDRVLHVMGVPPEG